MASASPYPLRLGEIAADTMLSWQWWRELKPNRSPEIDAVNREAGVPVGSYWCESSRYSSHNRSAKAHGIVNPFMRTASVAMQLRYARRVGSGLQVIPMTGNTKAFRGDTFCMKYGGGSVGDIGTLWKGHTGIILSDLGRYVMTVEGNAAASGSRNGDRVLVRIREKKTILALIRIPA